VLGAELALHRSAETKMENGELPSHSRKLFSVRSADGQRTSLYLTDGGLISVGRRPRSVRPPRRLSEHAPGGRSRDHRHASRNGACGAVYRCS